MKKLFTAFLIIINLSLFADIVTIKTKEEFENYRMCDNCVTVFYFYAEWCGSCKMGDGYLQKISKENSGVKFVKVDVDKDFGKDIAEEYKIQRVPTTIIFKEGIQDKTIIGVMTCSPKNSPPKIRGS